ncbi:MAG: choice-of-anchor D domain-containing protein, partial [Calditrichaeota bacterium]|nr:choice-of-anchor D domain-containing protein [Calditrichota bacterium]
MKRPATVSTLLALGLLSLTSAIFAQNYEFTPTEGGVHTLFVTRAEIDGAPVEDGDEIGVFLPDGEICFGAIVIDGQPPYIFDAYQADRDNPGFGVGDVIQIHIWDAGTERDLVARSLPAEIRFEVDGWTAVTLSANIQAQPEIDLADVTGHPFGYVTVDESVQWQFTIYNIGSADLVVESITSDNGAFSSNYDNDNPVRIEPGGLHSVTVIFRPAAAQEYNGRLAISSNDDNEGLLYLNLSGTGVSGGAPDINVSANALDFGEVIIGQFTDRTLSINNNGEATLHIASITDDHQDAGVYTYNFDNQQGVDIQPNGEFQLSIRFTPVAEGAHNANLRIVSNSPEEENLFVSLSGIGVLGQHFNPVETNIQHIIYVSEALLDGENLGDGDEIGVFTPNDICGGSAALGPSGPPVGFPAFGDDPETDEVEGFTQGQPFAFRVWDNSAEREWPAVVINDEGHTVFQNFNGFSAVRLNAQSFAAPEIEIALNERDHDFGRVLVDQTADWQFTIRNIGGAALNIDRIDSDNEMFTTDFGDEARQVEAGGSLVATVSFGPDREGEFLGTLTIFSNDGNESPFLIRLAGIGTIQRVPEIVVNPLEVNFGQVQLGRGAVESVVNIGNVGTGNLSVAEITIDGAGFSYAVEQQDRPIEIAPDGSITVTLQFEPQELGEHHGTLTIRSNDSDESIVVVALTGVGVPYRRFSISPDVGQNNHSIIVQSAWLDNQLLVENDEIGVFTPGGVCAGEALLVANQGNVFPLGIPVFADNPETDEIEGFRTGEAFSFRVWGNNPGQEWPAVAVYVQGSQVWADGGQSTVRLFAQSQDAPEIEIADADLEHNYGAVTVDDFRVWRFDIRNIGRAALTIESIESGNQVFTTDFDQAVDINPNGSLTISVTFTPRQETDYTGALTITSNDQNERIVEIALTGSGTVIREPEIVVTPQSINFGEVDTRFTRAEILTVTNEGTGDLTIDRVELAGAGFSHNFSQQTVLQPEASLQIEVTFAPQAAGEYNGTLTIYSDDEDEGEVAVTLTGVGIIGPHFLYTRTGTNHNLLVHEARLDGDLLVVGDEIGVFTSGGLCAGATVLDEEGGVFPAGFSAFGDDAGTQIIDGFGSGEAFSFRVYQRGGEEWSATAVYIEGQQVWTNNGFTELRLNAQTEAAPEIEIAEADRAHDYRSVAVGGVGHWQFFVRNIGGADLNISGLDFSVDVFSGEFAAGGQQITIEPNGSALLTVVFSPADDIEYTGALTIRSDDEDEPNFVINLYGVGTEVLEPEIAVEPMSLDFGRVAIGRSGEDIVRISNIGTADLTLYSAGIAGAGFTTNFDGEQTLPAGNTLTLTVTFTPQAAQEYNAAMTIRSDDEDEATVDVQLTGLGFIGRHFEYTRTSASHSLMVYAAEIDGQSLVEGDEIGVFTPGGDCAGASLIGEEEGALFPVGVAAWQAEENTPGFASGQPFAFKLWDASTPREYIATVEYGDGPQTWVNGGFTPITRLFAFTEATPVIRLSTDNLNFGEVLVDDASQLPLTISNIGSGVLHIGSVTVQGEVFNTNFGGEFDIQPGGQSVLMVIFTPHAEGEHNGVLTIASNDPQNGEIRVGLTGVGVVAPIPNIELSANTHNFGEVPVGQRADWVLTVNNTGTGDLNIERLSVQTEVYTVSLDGESSIPPRQSREIIVTFAPRDIREYPDRLTIESNDPDNGVVFVDLMGIGGLPGPYFRYISETGENASFLVTNATLDGELLTIGDEIGVFTPSGTCAGGVVLSENDDGNVFPAGFAVWGDDPNVAGRQGFFANEPFSFKFYDLSAREDIEAFPNYIEGQQVYQANGFTTLTLMAERERRPDITISRDRFNFGRIVVNNVSNRSLVISNAGTAVLNVSDISIEGDGVFICNYDGSFSLMPRETYNLRVTFAPQYDGEYRATIVIISNDPDEQRVEVALTGIATPPPPPNIALRGAGPGIAYESNLIEEYIGSMHTVVASDLDRDGDVDIVGAALNSNGFYWWENDGSERWTRHSIAQVNSPTTSAVVIDVDKDGDLDVVGTVVNAGVIWFENDGEQNFQGHWLENANTGAVRIRAADMDGDGDIDFVNSYQYSSELVWWQNDGRQNFTRRVIRSNYLDATGVTLVDMDFDGDMDILSTCYRPGYIILFENNSLGQFTTHFVCEDIDSTVAADAGDFDGDGDLDVVSMSYTQNRVSWFENTGQFNFTEHSILTDFLGPHHIKTDDIDSDGDTDIAVIGHHELIWLENNSLGQFVLNMVDPEMSSSRLYLDIADINGDSRLDMVGCGWTDPIVWYDNNPAAYSHNYSEITLGNTANWTLTIANSGYEPLIVNGVRLDNEAFATDFAGRFGGQAVIERGESIDFNVSFTPGQAIEYSGTLTIFSNDPDNGEVNVALMGMGTRIGFPDITLSAVRHDFGPVPMYEESQWILVIGNIGNDRLNVTGVSLDNDAFATDFSGAFGISPGSIRQLVVSFLPTEITNYSANLVIASDDPDEGEVAIALTGSGTAARPHFSFTSTDVSHSLLVQGATVNGNILVVGDEIGVFTPAGLCAGAVTLIAEDGSIFPAGLAAWGDDANTPVVDGFTANQTLTFRLWDISERAELTAAPQFIDGPQVYTPNGFTVLSLVAFTEAAPRLELTTRNIDFSLVPVRGARTNTLGILNRGDAALIVDGIEIDGAGYRTDFNNEAVEIAAGGRLDVNVIFEPQDVQRYDAVLTVVSNDNLEPRAEVGLTGQGIEAGPPQIVASQVAYDFGDVLIGLSANWTFTVTNTGGEDLIVQAPQVVGEGFSVDVNAGWTLESGRQRIVMVTFRPEEAQDYVATVILRSNDPNRAIVNIALRGRGVAGQFRWAYVETDNNMSLMIESADIDGRSLGMQDQIGVFTTDGLCAGVVVIEQFPVGLAAWGDDPSTQDIVDGFIAGEAMTFRVWDAEADFEAEAESQFIQGENAYTANAFALVRLSVSTGGAHFRLFARTEVNHSILVADGRLDEQLFATGDEIGVFTPAGLCAGAVVMEEIDGEVFPLGIAVWGDDANTGGIDGFREGEAFTFRYWDAVGRREYDAIPEFIEGPELWEPNGYSVVNLQAASGRVPRLALSTESLNFYNVVLGNSKTRSLTIINTGDAALIIENIFSFSEDYSVEFNEAVRLAPAESCEARIVFSPSELGDRSSELHIISNDPDNSEAIVTLIGFGIEAGPPRIEVTPVALDFGELLIGSSLNQTLRVSNSGGDDLRVNSLQVVGAGFRVDRGDGFIVESGAEELVTVTFAPDNVGEFNATLIVRSNDPNRGVMNIALRGVGIAGQYHWSFVETDNNMSLLVQMAEINGEPLAALDQIGVFTPDGLCAGAVIIEQDFPVGFAVWGDDPSTQEIVDGFTVGQPMSFRFWDESAGMEFDAEADFIQGENRYAINGFALLELYAVSAGPRFRYTPTDVNHSLLINEALLDGRPLVEGDEIGVFTRDELCAGAVILEPIGGNVFPTGLAAWGDDANTGAVDGFIPNEEFAFRYWDVSARCEYNATAEWLQGPDRFTVNGFSMLTLSGRSGRAPDIALSESTHDFRIVPVGSRRDWTLTIRNIGELELQVERIESSAEVFTTNFPDEPVVIEPGGEVPIIVSFLPSDALDYQGSITIISNDPDEGELTVALTGRGIEAGPPRIALSDETYDFGEVFLGLTSTWQFSIENQGGSDLTIDRVVSDNNNFIVDNPEGTVILTGEMITVGITFRPIVEGNIRGIISVYSDDPNNETAELRVSGMGVRGALRWQFRQTDNNMSLLIESAVLDGEMLVIGDQIGIFAPSGLPTSAVEVTADGFPIGMAVWGDDPSTDEIDGMITGQPLSYRIWDASADVEVEAVARYLQGEGIYVANGFALLTLSAFTPQEGAHFQFVETDNNHSLLVRAAILDGDPLLPGDEVGVLTPGRVVAGGFAIIEAGAEFGLTAWGDDPTTENVIDGFRPDEEFTFRVWDSQAHQEFNAIPNFIEGPQTYQVNGFSVLTLTATSGRQPAIYVADREHNFGGVEVGTTEDWALVVRNRGNASLHIRNLSIEGDEQFSLEFNEEITVAPDGNYIFTIYFSPNDVNDYYATLTLESDDPNEPEMAINLLGQGIIILRPEISLEPQSIDFGEVPLYERAEEFITIHNRGEGDLVISDMSTDNDLFAVGFQAEPREFYWAFVQTDNNMSLLIENATLRGNQLVAGNFIGVFTPGGLCAGYAEVTGDWSLGLAAFGDDASTDDVIEGFRANENILYRYWDTDAGREYAAQAEYSSGEGIYQPNAFAMLTLSSSGRPLAPAMANQTVVAPNESVDFIVYFTPNELGEHHSTLTIASNDESDPEVFVPLSGVCILSPVQMTLSTESHDFRTILVGESSQLVLTIGNSGQQILVVERIVIEGSYYRVDNSEGFELSQYETRDVTITFAPEDAGIFEGRLTIISNDQRGSLFVELVGVGAWFGIVEIAPELTDFGEVPIGDRVDRFLTVRNIGRGNLRLTDIRTEGVGFGVEWGAGEPREFYWEYLQTDNNMSVLVS